MYNNVWLAGAGNMAVEYTRVLKDLRCNFTVIGRGISSAEAFYEKTGIKVQTGGLEKYVDNTAEIADYAIVAVNVEELFDACKMLLKKGIKKILVEKPAGINIDQIDKLREIADLHKAQVYVAYNRRFYASTMAAKEIIQQDGGPASFSFEFTEWSHVIEKLERPKELLANWLLANSSHTIDLAFYLGGHPTEMTSYTKGQLDWYKNAAVFAGAGVTDKCALFSYQANWKGPGRWVVDIVTEKHRLLFKPIEKLQIQNIGSIKWQFADIDYTLDETYKPGLYLQTKLFLEDNIDERFVTITQQNKNIKAYSSIENGIRVCSK